MLPPIEETARRALIVGSLASIAGAALMLPLAASPLLYAPPAVHVAGIAQGSLKAPNPWKAAIVTARRDPFLTQAASGSAPEPARFASPRDIIGMRVIQGQMISRAAEIGGASVRAILFGAVSKAIVDADGTSKVVAAGDFIHGTRIERILPDRVVLADGSILVLPRKFP